jgi:hypothetical protein
MHLACVDTDLAPTPAECPAPSNGLDNVVFITAAVHDLGTLRCSGVAVTGTLIVTAPGCVVVPNALVEDYAHPPPPERVPPGAVHLPTGVDPADCAGGGAREDGSFSTLFATTLPAEAFDVYLPSERINAGGHPVGEVLRLPGTRCSSGVALLKLNSSIVPQGLSIAGGDLDDTDEPALLSYVATGPRYTIERRDLPAKLAAADAGASPPGSFSVPDTCPAQSGAGIFSASTGALIGVLASSAGDVNCQAPAPGLGVRVADFRRVLDEAAGPTLEGEAVPSASTVAACVR